MEYVSIISSAGIEYKLTTKKYRHLLSIEGDGMPEMQHVTTRSPFQHGETYQDYFLKPRVLQLGIHQKFCSREDYFKGRQTLTTALSPFSGESTLRTRLPNGEFRDLKVVINEGPKFEPRDISQWAEFSINEVVRFIAHDPTYYNPTAKSYTFPVNIPGGLFFPVTQLTFGGAARAIFTTLTYIGNWPTYPTITAMGPFTSFRLQNTVNSRTYVIDFRCDITNGDYVIFDLAHSVKTVINSDGDSLIDHVHESDLLDFRLEPSSNALSLYLINPTDPPSQVSISYYDRYLALGEN